jgi:hypothetical protein
MLQLPSLCATNFLSKTLSRREEKRRSRSDERCHQTLLFAGRACSRHDSTGEQSIEAFYNAVPSGVGKVKGTLIGPSHNDVTGQPDCKTAVQPCVNGVYGYLGYPTAWMMLQLQNDNYAHGAFVSGTGEMFSQALNWELGTGSQQQHPLALTQPESCRPASPSVE